MRAVRTLQLGWIPLVLVAGTPQVATPLAVEPEP